MRFLEKKLHAQDPNAPLGTANNPSHRIITIANGITLARIALTLLFLVLFCLRENRILCLVIYAASAITDFLDGYIARATQTVSWFGKLLDPLVDRFLIFSGVIGLCVVGELPLWIPCLLIGRDALLGLGMLVIKHIKHRPIDVLFIGKVTTALLMFGFAWMLLGWPVIEGISLIHLSWLPGLSSEPACMGIFLVYAGVICSLITFILYIIEGALAFFESNKAGK